MAVPTQSSAGIQKLLDAIDKDVFDCADALQNAHDTLKHRRGFDPHAVDKAEEYLREWPPVWMRDDTFTASQVPDRIGTARVREYIRQLEAEKAAAIDLAVQYGQIDGDHHKLWVIDQIVRALTNCPEVQKTAKDYKGEPYTFTQRGESEEYTKLIREAKAGEDGPETYGWDTGIAP